MTGAGGISRYRFAYDQQGNRASEAFFDAEDAPVAGLTGYARATYRYDQGGNLTEWQFFGPGGEAVATRVVVRGRDVPVGPMPTPDMPTVLLEKGDVVVRYAGVAISSTRQLHDMKRREDSDRAPREAVVVRGGKQVKVMLPAGFPGGDRFSEMTRRGVRGQGGNPFSLMRSLPGQGLTPPLFLGDAELRTEVVSP